MKINSARKQKLPKGPSPKESEASRPRVSTPKPKPLPVKAGPDKEVPQSKTTHLFQPGKSGNPAGRPAGVPNYSTLFRRALQKVQHDNKFDLFEEFIKQARLNPTVMIAAVKKLVPDKSEISFGSTELQQAQGQILEIITKHVHDPAVLAAIAADLDALAEEAEEEYTRA